MAETDRYARQQRFSGIGVEGQQRIAAARVVVVGCGALGGASADQLARAGVGHLRVIDRDIVEASNLQRQCLFNDSDAGQGRPKAIAAAERLSSVNGDIVVEGLIAQLDSGTIDHLLAEATVVVDGCDNFATRHLINEWCHREQIPWVYAACIGSTAMCLPILPQRQQACLRCLQEELPAAGDGPSCDSAGIIAPAVQQAASWQVSETLKIICGHHHLVSDQLRSYDMWHQQGQQLNAIAWHDQHCLVCGSQPTDGKRHYPSLAAAPPTTVHLCGRDGYQCHRDRLNLAQLTQHIGQHADQANTYFIRWQDGNCTLTAFTDGRILVQGVASAGAAEAAVDRWLS